MRYMSLMTPAPTDMPPPPPKACTTRKNISCGTVRARATPSEPSVKMGSTIRYTGRLPSVGQDTYMVSAVTIREGEEQMGLI
jgi:hypothetical protein